MNVKKEQPDLQIINTEIESPVNAMPSYLEESDPLSLPSGIQTRSELGSDSGSHCGDEYIIPDIVTRDFPEEEVKPFMHVDLADEFKPVLHLDFKEEEVKPFMHTATTDDEVKPLLHFDLADDEVKPFLHVELPIIGDVGADEEEDPLALSPMHSLGTGKLRNVMQINEMQSNQTKYSTQNEIDSYLIPSTDDTDVSIKNKYVLLNNNYQNKVSFTSEKGDDGVHNNISSQASRNDKLALTCSTDIKQDELGGIDFIQESNGVFCKLQQLRSKKGLANCKYMLCNHTQNIETELKYNKINKLQLHYNFPQKNDKSILVGQPSYQCNMCNHQNTSHKLHNHIQIGEPPYQRDVCKQSFNQKNHLIIRTHAHNGGQPYQCDLCKQSFNRRNELIIHTRIHTGERPYHCDVYKQSLNEKHSLINTHIHTGERPYQCDLCKQSFYRKSNLNRHTRTHTEKRPYQCHLCKQSFCRKSNLNRHTQTHTGERPYQCDVCNQSFNQKGNLKIHARTHTGERLYKCDVCKQSFKQRISLLRHTRTHDGNQCDLCIQAKEQLQKP